MQDSVYVNGIFIGNTTYQYPPRIYRIPAGVLKTGQNNITVRLISNGGQPSFVKEKPYKIIYQATDREQAKELNLKPTWKYRLGAPMPDAPEMMFFCYKPVCLYNAMIAPLKNYGICGALWYQGESNVSRRNEYAALLSAMISDWRRTFNSEQLPFYIVELADFLAKMTSRDVSLGRNATRTSQGSPNEHQYLPHQEQRSGRVERHTSTGQEDVGATCSRNCAKIQ